MSKIDELIVQYCPNGLEYKELKQIADVGTGNRNGNEGIDGGEYPLYVRSKYIKSINSYDFDEEAIIIPGEGGIGEIFHYVNGKYALHQRAYRINLKIENLLTRFVYFYMMRNFKSFIYKVAVNATVSSIRKPMIEKFQVPIPPLIVQEEIVNILDKFTALEAELEAELEARTHQYEYYRNELLSFQDKDVEWKTLPQISENLNSKRKPVKGGSREKGNIPYYGASGIVDYVKDYIFDGDFLLISEDGANLLTRNTPIAFSITGKSWVNNHAHVLKFKHYATRRLIEYYLNSIDLVPYITGAAQPKLNKQNLNNILVPVPSLEEQERIVAILDKFDALVNDISVGLPAEIAVRREQYEYYRGKLLTFEPLAVAQ